MGDCEFTFTLCVDATADDATLAALEELGCGVELQSYGLEGVASPEVWDEKRERHREIARRFVGPRVVHGPFLGLVYFYRDHLLSAAVQERLDRTFDVVRELEPTTLVLHTNWKLDHEALGLNDVWLAECARFWRGEIRRYEEIGVTVVLENLLEPDPDLMIACCDRVASERFKLCLDVGHVNVFSELPHAEWIARMGERLHHVHLHDNDGGSDQHLPPGRGSVDFNSLFTALDRHVERVTVSLELEATAEVKLESLRRVIESRGGVK
jgi:sugar phosphate isomerase/epimerase